MSDSNSDASPENEIDGALDYAQTATQEDWG